MYNANNFYKICRVLFTQDIHLTYGKMQCSTPRTASNWAIGNFRVSLQLSFDRSSTMRMFL